ncbi:MAG: tetratricopeptide repeat protein [Bacteroidales bacterium]|nr:tetratricopeptide repeat protein [Bacteroidales bacterium]
MKKSILSLLFVPLLLAGCGGYSKMVQNSKTIRYQPTPNPMETMDGKVMIKFAGSIPAQYFDKNVAVFMQPILVWKGGNLQLNPITLKGENVEGEGITINYENGGRFVYSDEVDFKPDMELAKVILAPILYPCKETDDECVFSQDLVKKFPKSQVFDTVVIADGVCNTSALVSIIGAISVAPTNYDKTKGITETADIYYPNGSAKHDWNYFVNKKFNAQSNYEDLKKVILRDGMPKQINVTGWSSPEGEETANVDLSKKRAEEGAQLANELLEDVIKTMAERANIKAKDFAYYRHKLLKEVVITTTAAGEDWTHFVTMVENSTIEDRNAIINVVETQRNVVKREQMIRNMTLIFPELERDIFPDLRRAQIALYYPLARKTDQELAKIATLYPQELTFEELMYAAYINHSYVTKLKLYKWATEHYSKEWSAWNNAGAAAFQLENFGEAERFLNVAKQMEPSNPEVLNNLGLLALAKKDYTLSEHYFNEAIKYGSREAENNLPILYLKHGDYEKALDLLKTKQCTYNLAFAQLMTDNTSGAIRTLDCCLEQTHQVAYLRAVCYARLDDLAGVLENLKYACDEEPLIYKPKAVLDIEFRKYWDNTDFKEIVKKYE